MLVQVAQQLQPELGFPARIAKPAQLVSGLVRVIADLAPEAREHVCLVGQDVGVRAHHH
jgi:hypothetical protein